MRYQRISADCHIDLPWIPPDLFTANSSAALKDRMPRVGRKMTVVRQGVFGRLTLLYRYGLGREGVLQRAVAAVGLQRKNHEISARKRRHRVAVQHSS